MVSQEEANLKYSHNIINKRHLQISKAFVKGSLFSLFLLTGLLSVTAIFLVNPLLCVFPLPLPAALSAGTRKRLVISLQGGGCHEQQALPWLCFSLAKEKLRRLPGGRARQGCCTGTWQAPCSLSLPLLDYSPSGAFFSCVCPSLGYSA